MEDKTQAVYNILAYKRYGTLVITIITELIGRCHYPNVPKRRKKAKYQKRSASSAEGRKICCNRLKIEFQGLRYESSRTQSPGILHVTKTETWWRRRGNLRQFWNIRSANEIGARFLPEWSWNFISRYSSILFQCCWLSFHHSLTKVSVLPGSHNH